MAQGFFQGLLNRQPQPDTYNMPPLQAPAPQLQPIMIDQQGQTMSPEQINAFYQQPAQQIPQQGIGDRIASALLGQQSQAQEPQTQIDVGNGMIASGAGVNPRTGGLLPDLISGFKENSQTPFSMQNLDPVKDKGFATRVGEGLGTFARGLDSPLGRMALTAGIVGATGGSGLQALAYGGTAGVGNQALRTQDAFYRQQLQNEGVDTSQIQGYINDNMFQNLSQYQYRKAMSDAMLERAKTTGNTRGLTFGSLMLTSPEFAKMMNTKYDFSNGKNQELLETIVPASLMQGWMPAKQSNVNYSGGTTSRQVKSGRSDIYHHGTGGSGGGSKGGSSKKKLLY